MNENKEQTGLCDECSTMAMDCGDMMASAMHNDHHPMCPKYVANFAGASRLLGDLVKGIDYWASQEDGVPDEIWDAYCKAKFLTTRTRPDSRRKEG